MELLNQSQWYRGYRYKVTDLIEASKDLPTRKIKVQDINTDYDAPCENYLDDFAEHVRDVMDANTEYPLILAPSGFVLDGKHRLIKAIVTEMEYLPVRQFETMPNCGIYDVDD